MTHQGRVHRITSHAQEISARIQAGIPKDKIFYGPGLRRPIWEQARFQDTDEERRFLKKAAKEYKLRVRLQDELLAHGSQGCSDLCQILIDGKLKHIQGIESYGLLDAYGESIQAAGYWDHGWGVFVATSRTIQACVEQSRGKDFLEVPLQELRGIILPTPLVELVRNEFPGYGNLIKGYRQFGEELEKANSSKGRKPQNFP